MKKLLIASAALAMVAGTVQAQSSVTIYGLIDAGYGSTETKFTDTGTANVGMVAASTAGSLRNSVKNTGIGAVEDPTASSRLGFRGTEDLGGGLSANFNLELDTSLNGGEAVSTNNARTSTVGFSSKTMGTINVGRQLTGVHGVVAGFNPLAGNNMVGDILYSSAFRAHSMSNIGANFAAPAAATFGTSGATAAPILSPGVDSLRMNRGVSYVSPAMNGFTARVDLAQDKVNASTQTATAGGTGTSVKHQGLTVNYAKGPIRAAASTHTAKADLDVAATADGQRTAELKINGISAAYQLTPAISLQAAHVVSEYSLAGALNNKTKATRLGGNYNVGKWVFAAQYGVGDVSSPAADVANSVTVGTASAPGSYGVGTAADRTAMQLAAFYNLSKRTALYAAYGTQEQKITAANARAAGGTNNAVPADDRATAVGDQVKWTQMAVGIRHSF
jgi:predicted porin